MLRWLNASAMGMLAIATTCTLSQTIITRLRSQRSTNAPAGSAKRKRGSELQAATMPACAAEWVMARINSGNARLVTCVPAVEMSWPLQSSTKSRLRQSDLGRWSGVGFSDIATGDDVIFCLLCEVMRRPAQRGAGRTERWQGYPGPAEDREALVGEGRGESMRHAGYATADTPAVDAGAQRDDTRPTSPQPRKRIGAGLTRRGGLSCGSDCGELSSHGWPRQRRAGSVCALSSMQATILAARMSSNVWNTREVRTDGPEYRQIPHRSLVPAADTLAQLEHSFYSALCVLPHVSW